MSIKSAMWTAKAKFLFYCWLSFYFTSSELQYQYQNYYILAISFLTKKLKILISTQKLFEDFPKRWPRIRVQRERKLGRFDSFRKLSFVWRTLLITFRGFRTTWWEKKKQGWATNRYKASSMDSKNLHAYCVI